MAHPVGIEPRLRGADPIRTWSRPTVPTGSLDDLIGQLVASLERQRRLRAGEERWEELASVQSTLHELRAALAAERARHRDVGVHG